MILLLPLLCSRPAVILWLPRCFGWSPFTTICILEDGCTLINDLRLQLASDGVVRQVSVDLALYIFASDVRSSVDLALYIFASDMRNLLHVFLSTGRGNSVETCVKEPSFSRTLRRKFYD